LIAFTSQRDGDWEAYIMDSNGGNVRNVSNSPTSNDGLPTISPDGQWIAFVSDKGGLWAVWAAPASGGPAQKLFDLPDQDPWGEDDRNWLNERISWGP
jgi:TolB protein